MKNERFCQITLFCSRGFENPWQLVSPFGQVIVNPVKVVVSNEEFGVLVTPADCGQEAVPAALWHSPGGALANGAPMLNVSTPEEASESLLKMLLLRMATFNESCSDIPAPSQPTSLLTIMLLVTETLFQSDGCVGKVETSDPLICCRRMPPPLPLSAMLPWIRLALITRLWPVPSLSPGGQSWSIWCPHTGSVSG